PEPGWAGSSGSRHLDVVGELTTRGQNPAFLRLRSRFQSAGTAATESWKLNSPTTSSFREFCTVGRWAAEYGQVSVLVVARGPEQVGASRRTPSDTRQSG